MSKLHLEGEEREQPGDDRTIALCGVGLAVCMGTAWYFASPALRVFVNLACALMWWELAPLAWAELARLKRHNQQLAAEEQRQREYLAELELEAEKQRIELEEWWNGEGK